MTRCAASVVLSAIVFGSASTLTACGDDDGTAPGIDAGAFDAGAFDAAGRDAGPEMPDAGVSDASYVDAFFPRADGATACGAATCGPDQICLFHCCSTPCEVLDAGATCLGGSCMTSTGELGCRTSACRPAPPECVIVAPECTPTVSCPCLPAAACGEGVCGRFAVDGVHCLCR